MTSSTGTHAHPKFEPDEYSWDGHDFPQEMWKRIWAHSEAINVAPMFVSYRRYADDLRDVRPITHRLHALSLDWNPINITQDPQDIVDQMVHYLLGNNRRLRAFTWDELPDALKDRLCRSSVFPIGQQKSREWLDENVEWADIKLIMTETVYKAVMS